MPFLNNPCHEVDYDGGLQIFADQINHPDAKAVHPTKAIIRFKKFQTGINFEYKRGKVSGNYNMGHFFKMQPIVMLDVDTYDKTLDISEFPDSELEFKVGVSALFSAARERNDEKINPMKATKIKGF